MLKSLPYINTLFYRDALIVAQSVVSAVLVIAALLTAFWVNRAKNAIPYTEILTATEEGGLTVEASVSDSSDEAPTAPRGYTMRIVNSVLHLLVLVLWYWSIVISIGSNKSQLMWSLFGLISIYFIIAVGVKVIHVSDHSIAELNRALRCQAAFGICYIIQLPTMWAYHSETWITIIFAAIAIMITLSLQNSCVAIFATIDHGIGVNLVGTPVEWPSNFQWSSRFTRALTFRTRPCQQGDTAPCHIYLTAARNLSSGIIINAHFSYSDTRKVEFVYRDSSDGVEHRTLSQQFWVFGDHTRDVHVAYLDNLPPAAVIEFWILSDGKVVSDVRRFRTAPVTGEVTIAVGGDAGANDLGQHVSEQMAKYSPYAAVFAGDVSYDNSLVGCACIWDKFLSSWDKIRVKPKDENDSEGFMIPLIFTTGNHDLGVNEKPKSERYPSDNCDVGVLSKARPLFYGYFAFEAPGGKVPEICDRSHSHVHLIGDSIVLWALDSDYAVPADTTRDWLRSTLTEINPTDRPLRHLAAYHLPMYPALRDEAASKQGARLREVWEDEFSRLGVRVAFEHHVHSFKRTKPLLKGKPIDASSGNVSGTIFVGDGKWGVLPIDSPSEDMLAKEDSRFVKLGTYNHVWIAKIDLTADGKMTLIAVNEDGVEVDSVDI